VHWRFFWFRFFWFVRSPLARLLPVTYSESMDNSTDLSYPVAETFFSTQGEGRQTGAQMLFLRLAGCNVGRYNKENGVYATCTTADGREFVCDTDYTSKGRKTLQDVTEALRALLPECYPPVTVSVTGGEPFLHKKLAQLIAHLLQQSFVNGVQIETSGTLPIGHTLDVCRRALAREWDFDTPNPCDKPIWVTCSPKGGFLPENLQHINELKFLVDADFSEQHVTELLKSGPCKEGLLVWLQPVNEINSVSTANTKLCKAACARHPHWGVSIQLHKILGVA
jgi:7-carboxy-7-deazaguanine synthase